MSLPTAKKLYLTRTEIRSLGKKYGFHHIRVRPPIFHDPLDKKSLHFIVTICAQNPDFLAQIYFEQALEKLLSSTATVEVKQEIKASMSNSKANRTIYKPLLKAAVRLSSLNPDISLEEQWEKKGTKRKLLSLSSPRRSEELLTNKMEQRAHVSPDAFPKKEKSKIKSYYSLQ